MRLLLSLVRFSFNTGLLLLALLAVAIIFGSMLNGNSHQVRRAPGPVNSIAVAPVDPARVKIPPGWRMEQLAEYLHSAGIMDGNQLLDLAHKGNALNRPVLSDRPANTSYEGYLFPGTYNLSNNPTPEYLVARMLENMGNQLPTGAFELARQQGLTLYQVITLASIIERETANTEEKPIIASVYLNRLNPANNEPYLRADPTVQYAMGYQTKSGQWWKTPVSLDEYDDEDSPYNTYLYQGLPPGPISSPGIDSILAVLYPAQTNYLFFVCRLPNCADGRHTFAATYEEHLQNVAVYWGQQ